MPTFRLGPAEVRFTGRADGDLSRDAGDARLPRRLAIVDRPWKTARQVHGSTVAVVDAATPAAAIGDADALVSTDPSLAVAVLVADCAPVVLAGGGVVGVAHAGWRGLEAGVVEATAAAMRAAGAGDLRAALGPCIHAECYAFGVPDLDRLAGRFGDGVRATTADGAPALDLPAAVTAALALAGATLDHDADACTACRAGELWSHRARGERQRQAGVAWLV